MKWMKRLSTGVLAVMAGMVSVAQTGANNTLLWKVSGKGHAKPSYVFGTMHLVCPEDYVWTPAMKKSLDQSDKLCLEMDLDDNKVLMAATTGLLDMSGKKLHDYFTSDQFVKVTRYVKDSLGMDISMFEMMRPVALQMLMTTRSADCEGAISYEDKLMKSAQANGKEVLGLESAEEQIAAIAHLNVDSTIKELLEAVEGTGAADDMKEYRKMVEAYKAQDITAMHDMIVNSGESGDVTYALLDERNAKWISRMEGMMDKSTVFFAVGAGHLGGNTGVISLLRKQGYIVEPIR